MPEASDSNKIYFFVLFLSVLLTASFFISRPIKAATSFTSVHTGNWNDRVTWSGNIFGLPTGVFLDSSGNIYAADFSANKIVKLNASGTVLNTFTASSSLSNPIAVALDSSDN